MIGSENTCSNSEAAVSASLALIAANNGLASPLSPNASNSGSQKLALRSDPSRGSKVSKLLTNWVSMLLNHAEECAVRLSSEL